MSFEICFMCLFSMYHGLLRCFKSKNDEKCDQNSSLSEPLAPHHLCKSASLCWSSEELVTEGRAQRPPEFLVKLLNADSALNIHTDFFYI